MSQINFAEDKAESITQANDAGSFIRTGNEVKRFRRLD
jgi:hypothetical protein